MATKLATFWYILVMMRLVFCTPVNLTSWTSAEQQFAFTDHSGMVAFDDLTRNIWIIGGVFHPEKVYIYNIDIGFISDVSMIYNISAVSNQNYISGASALIIDRTIYFASTYRLRSLNIQTYEFVDSVLIYPSLLSADPCIVTDSTQSKLYLTSSWGTKGFVIYDISTKQYAIGPQTNEIHRGGLCYVFNNILYAASGRNSSIVEYIDLNHVNSDINSTVWNVFSEQLPTALYTPASAMYKHYIFIMGGARSTEETESQQMYIIDTKTKTIIDAGLLPQTIVFTSAICIEHRIYTIMGRINGSTTNKIWFADVSDPSAFPSLSPSIFPSKSPTITNEILVAGYDPTVSPSVYLMEKEKDTLTTNVIDLVSTANAPVSGSSPGYFGNGIILQIGAIVLGCCVIGVFVFCLIAKMRKKRKQAQKDEHMVQAVGTNSNPDNKIPSNKTNEEEEKEDSEELYEKGIESQTKGTKC